MLLFPFNLLLFVFFYLGQYLQTADACNKNVYVYLEIRTGSLCNVLVGEVRELQGIRTVYTDIAAFDCMTPRD